MPAWQRPTHSVVRFGYGDTVAVHRDDSADAARPLPGQGHDMFHEGYADRQIVPIGHHPRGRSRRYNGDQFAEPWECSGLETIAIGNASGRERGCPYE